MAGTSNITVRDNASSPSELSRDERDGRVLARAPTRRLTRDVVGLTTIKVLILAGIYALFFWGVSHRLPVDAATHIAGSPAPETTETR